MIDEELSEYLNAFGAVLLEGPQWCGKTTTAMQKAQSILKMQNPDMRNTYLETAKIKPSLLLKGKNPRLIDEWQIAPILWDSVRTSVDERNETGLYILTGSNSVDKSQIMHSGTGRIARLRMSTMSLFETNESNGKISLSGLFDNPDIDIDGIESDMSIEQLIFAACRGGWPATLNIKSQTSQLLVAKNYVTSVCENDISTIDSKKRNPNITRAILRSYARNVSTLAKKTIIHGDITANYESISMPTFDDYLDNLRKLFVVSEVEAWNPAIRSSSSMRSGLKREFSDPSIAVAALELTPTYLEQDLKTFGFIFECMIARDLRVYSHKMGGYLNYYHDRNGLEADFVLHLSDGRYALIECKLGSFEIEDGARHLLEIKRLINEANQNSKQIKIREPSLLLIITGGNMAYTRPDGVKVVPLATLRG